MKSNLPFLQTLGLAYQNIFKPILFSIDPEIVHNRMVNFGQILGKIDVSKNIASGIFVSKNSALKQKIAGITFQNPIGLAAGFDYEARLTQILPSMGFGFESVGTITNLPYDGNPRPMLGRLPKSKSLMVNKGFKNLGAQKTITNLAPLKFKIPIGISIGRTNTRDLITQKQSVEDIVNAFKLFEKSKVKHSYYELNISCPNLFGNITFYSSKNLDDLLKSIDRLHLSRPVLVKMPIIKTNAETLEMLKVIAKHTPIGVIFGNLQKDRTHPSLDPSEVKKFKTGNFSGKPTFDRSNELIALAYQHYKDRFVIIGCGGVFSAEDAYQKIKNGATLVQLITGMIFQGPQLIAQINLKLVDLLKADGFTHISQAKGTAIIKE